MKIFRNIQQTYSQIEFRRPNVGLRGKPTDRAHERWRKARSKRAYFDDLAGFAAFTRTLWNFSPSLPVDLSGKQECYRSGYWLRSCVPHSALLCNWTLDVGRWGSAFAFLLVCALCLGLTRV